MKCSYFEKEIYLYNVLTPQEREKIDAHASTCASCMQLFNSVRELHKVVVLNRPEPPSLRNHAAMTHQIMEAVVATQQSKRPHLAETLQRIIVAPMRHHMAVLSIVLVLFFAKEYSGGMEKPKIVKPYRHAPGPKTQLNLAAFHTVFFETKKTNSQSSNLIADCVTRCLAASTADCKGCAEKFSKP